MIPDYQVSNSCINFLWQRIIVTESINSYWHTVIGNAREKLLNDEIDI